MNLKEFNNLTDLFFYQAEKQNPDEIFLEWLNTISRKKYSWSQTISCVYKVANVLKNYVQEGDRVLLVSENRPEWLITDMAIMLSKAITVPAYTTYTENDYKYLIEDCKPTIVIVSNNELHKKLEKIINEKDFIKCIISFNNLVMLDNKKKYLNFENIVRDKL